MGSKAPQQPPEHAPRSGRLISAPPPPKRRVLDLSGISGQLKQTAKPPNVMQSRNSKLAAMKGRGRPGHRAGVMNSLERKYAQFLTGEVAAGRVAAYQFEAHKLKVNDDPASWWTPDFVVVHSDGRIEFVDTKGIVNPTQQLKIKIAAGRHTAFYFTVVKWKNGQWERTPIEIKREVIG